MANGELIGTLNINATNLNGLSLDNYTIVITETLAGYVNTSGVETVTTTISEITISEEIVNAGYAYFYNDDDGEWVYLFYDSAQTKPVATIPPKGGAFFPMAESALFAKTGGPGDAELLYRVFEGDTEES